MCCVLQGAERVFPSSTPANSSKQYQQKHLLPTKEGQQQPQPLSRGSSPLGAHDLPLESLWAAGLDDGMGFPQRCSYANQRSANTLGNHMANHVASTPDDVWVERNAYRTHGSSAGNDTSPSDEIWTLSNDRKFFRTPTISTGIGSSLNLRDDNNRSLESRDCDFYSTDLEDNQSKDFRRYYPNTPTTSGLGSSSERQSVETQRSKDLPDHLWAAAMEDGFSRFNAVKSLQTITRQPRPNHDWVRTEKISRFAKHRTISQSPKREHLPEIWTSKLNEAGVVSGFATHRSAHKCRHQTRRSFSTSIVADLAATPDGSQQSLGSAEYLIQETNTRLDRQSGDSDEWMVDVLALVDRLNSTWMYFMLSTERTVTFHRMCLIFN